MDPVQIYGLTADSMFIICLLYCASPYISRWIQDRTLFYVFKYLVYPYLIRRHRLLTPISRWHALLMIIYWSGTAPCNIVGVDTIAQAGNRAGSLAALHLIPLLFANRAGFAADLLGLSLQTYLRLHSSFGVMALLQSLIHIVIFLRSNTLRTGDHLQFYGLLGAIAIRSLTLLSVLRTPLFEFFQKTHCGLAILVAYAIWRHLSLKPVFSRFYLIIAGGIFALTTIARYSRLILRNMRLHKPWATTNLIPVGDAVRIKVTVPRPWDVRAGQYVYVWMPGISFWSPFQSHPFMISWWDHDVHGKGTNIYLLVKPASGFTQRLMEHAGSCNLKAWVDGPYGKIKDIGDYGSVIMFASGIGIAAQVPYIKELLEGFREARIRTKRISLIWRLDKESDQDWVQNWMTELLAEDKDSYILRIGLYVLGSFDNDNTSIGDKEKHGEHGSPNKLYAKPDLEQIIESEIQEKRGRLLITTSTECDMQERIQQLAQKHLNKDMKLMHLAFQPREHQSIWSPKQPDISVQGVA